MQRLKALQDWCDKRFPQTGVSWLTAGTSLALLVGAVALAGKILTADMPHLATFFSAIGWPAVTLGGLLLFRKPIEQFLAGLSQRVTKLSLFKVELQLQEVKAKEVPSPDLTTIKSSHAIAVADSGSQIFAQLNEERFADYVVVDLGPGDEWLTSRLYIVAALFEQVRGVRCVVFTDGTGSEAGSFVGTASLNTVRWKLVQKFPWYEVAFAKALTDTVGYNPGDVPETYSLFRANGHTLDPWKAEQIARAFIKLVQDKPQNAANGWIEIRQGVWERAEWITHPFLRDLLQTELNKSAINNVEDLEPREVARRILAKPALFVAALSNGKFDYLFNREKLLERLASDSSSKAE